MANTLRIKRSTGSSAPTSLANAELAFSEGNETLFVGKGTGGAGGSATSIIKIGGIGGFFDKDTVRSANAVLSGPTTGSDAAPTFRALVAADIPTIAHTKISDFDTGVRTNTLDQMAAPAGAVAMNSQKITGLADPTADADAANKGYVDGVAQGLDVKDSVVATTTANGTLSSAFANGQSIDGVTLQTGDRILIKNQSTASQNGIYNVQASGAPSRTTDMGTGSNAAGAFVFVEQGTVNAENGFTCTSDTGSAVVGTNNLTFAQFSGAGQIIAGDGLDKSGNTLSADLKANGGLVIESTELALKLDASSITGTLAIGDGGTGATSATAALTALGLSNYAKTLIDDADAAAARSTLGLGSIATQAANSVAITGGSVTNLTTFDGITVDGGSY
tara:strand:+ start:134 stop:1306 length:1173 start_codon:yes stop_codon:yes gene_type:complete